MLIWGTSVHLGHSRVVNFLAAGTFSVYLLHDNIEIRSILWTKVFDTSAPSGGGQIAADGLRVAVIIFGVSLLVSALILQPIITVVGRGLLQIGPWVTHRRKGRAGRRRASVVGGAKRRVGADTGADADAGEETAASDVTAAKTAISELPASGDRARVWPPGAESSATESSARNTPGRHSS